MWTREPVPGDPAEDIANDRIGIVVAIHHASDTLVLSDSEGEWEAPLHETQPYSVTEDW